MRSMRRAECGVCQLHHASVIEHEPRVAVVAARIVEPLHGPIVARGVVVVEHHAFARCSERRLEHPGVPALLPTGTPGTTSGVTLRGRGRRRSLPRLVRRRRRDRCRAGSSTKRSMVEASIALARNLKMTTVAEGVQERADWDLLAELGCDVAQGYFIVHPMNEEGLDAWSELWTQRVEA